MTKAELVEQVAKKSGLTKMSATDAVNAITDTIQETLASGEFVQIVGFGTFNTAERAERQGRNPATGETITIPAKTVVTFKAGKTLKDSVN